MIVILEGVDGSGKSTLADAVIETIKKRYPDDDIEYIHSSQLEADPIDEYALEFEAYVPGQGHHFVIDRLHWGETIYGELYRGGSALTPAAFRWVEMYLKARGATTWHVSADLETVENRLRTRGEDYLESRDVEFVWSEFQKLADSALTCGGSALTDRFTVWDWAEQIVNDAVYNETEAANVYRPEYIGRALPTVLLVGDAQGNSDPGVTKAPFIARGKSSGVFLFGALPELWWHQLGVVNAHETDLNKLIDDLYYPAVVALGVSASDELDRLGIKHGTVPHPQKIRRFNHSMQSQYGGLIRTASTDGNNHLSWPKS